MASRSRLLEMGLAVYAGAIFVILWVGAAYALLAAPDLIDDAWVWLTRLSTVPASVRASAGAPEANFRSFSFQATNGLAGTSRYPHDSGASTRI